MKKKIIAFIIYILIFIFELFYKITEISVEYLELVILLLEMLIIYVAKKIYENFNIVFEEIKKEIKDELLKIKVKSEKLKSLATNTFKQFKDLLIKFLSEDEDQTRPENKEEEINRPNALKKQSEKPHKDE
jgi:hypothetical protein